MPFTLPPAPGVGYKPQHFAAINAAPQAIATAAAPSATRPDQALLRVLGLYSM